MYLVPEKSRIDKENNKQTLQFAEAIRAKRIVELRNGEFGFKKANLQNTLFFDYFEALCEKKKMSTTKANAEVWNACLYHLNLYERNKKITFADITSAWIIGFKKYLDTSLVKGKEKHTSIKLSANTKFLYFTKFKACINQAYKDGIIKENPLLNVENYRSKEAVRMYLTYDEMKLLVDTPCESENLKRVFLFSCLTGLRKSDIERLKWEDVYLQGNFTRIIFRQKKTGGQEYLDINSQAAELMGERLGANEKVFKIDPCSSRCSKILQRWVDSAGIDKRITFHCARHSFAVMMLDIGTDLYTVSKLLGHREIGTTQIYAKVLDKSKQEAVAVIPAILKRD